MWTDKFGNSINVNDYIIYGCNLGRCASLQLGKVRGYKEKTDYSGEPTGEFSLLIENEEGKKTALQYSERIIVVNSMYDEKKSFKFLNSKRDTNGDWSHGPFTKGDWGKY